MLWDRAQPEGGLSYACLVQHCGFLLPVAEGKYTINPVPPSRTLVLQELLNRGWRRSGCWLYKPDLRETCCPPYTIRLDVRRFQPTKARKLQQVPCTLLMTVL